MAYYFLNRRRLLYVEAFLKFDSDSHKAACICTTEKTIQDILKIWSFTKYLTIEFVHTSKPIWLFLTDGAVCQLTPFQSVAKSDKVAVLLNLDSSYYCHG